MRNTRTLYRMLLSRNNPIDSLSPSLRAHFHKLFRWLVALIDVDAIIIKEAVLYKRIV